MDQEQTQALSAIATLLLEMTARQMAIFALLKEQPGMDEQKIIQATEQARKHLGNYNNLMTIGSRMSVDSLRAFEKTIRGILFPHH